MIRRDPLADPKPLIRRLHAYVAYYLGDGPEADDVTSEAIERALRYRSSYDPGKGAPITWLIGIARRLLGTGETATEPMEELPEQEASGDLELMSVTRVAVRAAVAALPERDRDLVALRYGADLTSRQIGELLGLSTNGVEVALHRLHARLRVALVADFGGEGTAEPKAARKGSDTTVGI